MIPVFSLERQNKKIGKEISQAIKEVIAKGVFILGPKVEEFEREFAKYIGVKYAVGVASGTDALTLSLLSIGVGKGDEVIVPANAYPTAFAVTASGAVPKLVDIDPVTFTINPAKIPEAITSKTKAIIPVHLYGQPAEMEEMRGMREMGDMGETREMRGKRKIYLIEDCAQAHGAEIRIMKQESRIMNQEKTEYKNHNSKFMIHDSKREDKKKKRTYIWKKVGSIGDVGCFSFYPTKNLGCFGDGGMVVTNSKEIADRVRLLRMYGEESRYKSVLLGRNSRLDELQAAILLVKLKHLNEWNGRRREIAEKYLSHLRSLGHLSNLRHVYHLFVIRAKERDKLKKYLEEKGIGTGVHYPTPVHLVPSFAYLGYKKGDFPESEKASREILSLPMYPELEDREIEKVVEAISQFYTMV